MKDSAASRYQALAADRTQFLDDARDCAKVTLPYLVTESGLASGERLPVPMQSLGARGVNVLSSKLMLSLFPINTSFFKLQLDDSKLAELPGFDQEVRSEVDLALSKMEKIITQQIAETSDRVHLHNAMKHLVVAGNVLIFMGKKSLKVYPLERYVVSRDGNGNAVEIITKEYIHRTLLPKEFQREVKAERDANSPGDDGPKFGATAGLANPDDATVYTYCKLVDGHWHWHQECDGKVIKGSHSRSPQNLTQWLPLTWNKVEGEAYGRSRVSEYLGDLRSLEGLYDAMVSGSAVAAKVVFTVSPSATVKPQSLARASTGSIIAGRPDDIGVVQVGKTADFRTVMEMIRDLTTRLSDAFLILNPRASERTTATELNLLANEINEQLGGIYGSLTHTLLYPYLVRKLHVLQRTKALPSLPKGLVMPTVVAGLNSVGRQQDRAALIEFIQTVSQGMGPEALSQFINPMELMKRFAASMGIDTLNLIKDAATMDAEMQQAQQQQMQASMMNQMGQLAKSPMAEQLMQDYARQTEGGGQPEAPPPQPQG